MMAYKLLDFTKPKKVEIEAGFEDGPIGGYVPQMSQSDARKWKAKHFNLGKENARIELRKSFEANNGQGSTQVTMFVALDGWDFASKHEHRSPKTPESDWFHKDTRGLNVRMSMNGPLLMTFEQFREIDEIVREAEDFLKTSS